MLPKNSRVGCRNRSIFARTSRACAPIAVMAVVLFHAAVPGIGGGYVGVDVFFVISGFLITGLLWREVSGTGTVRLRSFYGARARRLLPASATVGVITMIASVLLLPPLRVPTVLYDGIASALYVGNYWFVIDNINYFSDALMPSPFLHYWSLGVEEQFYLVWAPLILGTAWFIRRFRRNKARAISSSRRPYLVVLGLVAVISFALSLVITSVVPAAAFFSLPTRAWQLAVGGLVALTAIHWQRLSPRMAAIAGWAGLGLIVLACIWFTAATPFPGTAALLPTARRGAGDRRRLRHTFAGLRAVPEHVADARDRPHLLLLVFVALAGVGARTSITGSPAGTGRTDHRGPAGRRAGVADPALSRKPAALRPEDPQLAVAQPRARCPGHRDCGLCRPRASEGRAHPGRARRAGNPSGLHRHASVSRRFGYRRLRRSGATSLH